MKKLLTGIALVSTLMLSGCSQPYPTYDSSNWVDFSSSSGFTFDATNVEVKEGFSNDLKTKLDSAISGLVESKNFAISSSNTTLTFEVVEGITLARKTNKDILSSLNTDSTLPVNNEECNINNYQYISAGYPFAKELSVIYADGIDFSAEAYNKIVLINNEEKKLYAFEFNESKQLQAITLIPLKSAYKDGALGVFINKQADEYAIKRIYTIISALDNPEAKAYFEKVLKIVGTDSYFVQTNNLPEDKTEKKPSKVINYISEVTDKGGECVVGTKTQLD